MASFERIPHIGEKIFMSLTGKDILKCRLVCQSWKQIQDDPIFWLIKLNSIGQPKCTFEKWMNLIGQAHESGFSLTTLANCLRFKFFKFVKSSNYLIEWYRVPMERTSEFRGFMLKLPPIFNALFWKNSESEELLKFIVNSDKNFAKPIQYPSENPPFSHGLLVKLRRNTKSWESNLIGQALSKPHISSTMIKFLISKMDKSEYYSKDWAEDLMWYSILKNDLEIFKLFDAELYNNWNTWKMITSKAVFAQNITILDYLFTINDPNDFIFGYGQTILHLAATSKPDSACFYCECEPLLKFLVPKMNNFDALNNNGHTALHIALYEKNLCPVWKAKIKILAAKTDLNLITDHGNPVFSETDRAEITKVTKYV